MTTRIVAAALAAAALLGNAAAACAEDTTIRLGTQPFISSAAFFIGIEKGYFKAADVDVQPTLSRASGSEVLNGLLAKQFDVLGAGLTVATFNAILRGADIQLIADKGADKGERAYDWLVVRKALADSGKVKRVADLKGMDVAAPGIGTAYWIEAEMLVEDAGLKPYEVRMVKLQQPDSVAGLVAGTVDAALLGEPFMTQSLASGKAVTLASAGSIGHFQVGAIMTTGAEIATRRPVLTRFLAAYMKAARDYAEHPQDAANVAAIVKYTGLDPATVARVRQPYFAPSGALDPAVIDQETAWLVAHKLLPKAPPASTFIDNSLLPK